jgi:hypothetical protein
MLHDGGMALTFGAVEMLAGNLEGADREYERGIRILRDIGETGVLSTLASMRAEVLYRLNRREEMEAALALARETGAQNDISTQAQLHWVDAMARADNGQQEDAERLIKRAVEMVEPTDFLELRAGAFEALAHVERRAGRNDGWQSALQRALAEHEGKANLVGARRVRELLEKGPPGSD